MGDLISCFNYNNNLKYTGFKYIKEILGMQENGKEYSKLLITWWVGLVQRHLYVVLSITLVATAAMLFYLKDNFRINTDLNNMISDKLPFRKVEKDFSAAFPQFSNTIVVVLDGDTPELAMSARGVLSERLKKTGLYKTIYEPGSGKFFERNGLLYLSREELEGLADRLANAQPLLAFLSRDLSLRGLFSVLGMVFSHSEVKQTADKSMDRLFDQMAGAFEGAADRRPHYISWESIMFGEKETEGQRQQFIILQPDLNKSHLSGDEVYLETVRRAAKELDINEANGVKLRITGDMALAYENLVTVRSSTGIATVVSILMVGVILFIGLGSGRMVFAGLLTLIIGLIWTTVFAIAFVGSLNLISITFAVLFVGLGIDYSIQFCLRYRELIYCGYGPWDCISTTARGVGRTLLLSCITVAIGFYSFVPTPYSGVAELGLISGTGMLLSFFATITVLPMLLIILRTEKRKGFMLSFGKTISSLPYRHPKAIVAGAILLGLASIPLLPMVYFDYNPLDLYGKKSEAVSTIRELFKNVQVQPWTISVLVKGEDNAKRLAEKLGKLKEVKMTVMLSDLVPEKQSEKLGIISDIALFMPPGLGSVRERHLGYAQDVKALDGFEKALKTFLSSSRKDNPHARHLYAAVQKFRTLLTEPVKGKAAFSVLEKEILSGLPSLFNRLETSLQARAFGEADLPREFADQYVATDGRYRVQVFPSENILNVAALKRFVLAVRAVAPDATDAPVTIYESGVAVASSFRYATIYALIAITLFLLIELRSFSVTAMILIPLVLAMFLTGAASVLFDIPLNFANVIVVPLLLGVGVHSGIIFMLRYLTEPPQDGNMLRTSSARAVLLSTLTLIISTSSLALSPHSGIASMGMLLTICLGFLLICILMLLPALTEISGRRSGKRSGD
jgi:hopanoid biosynthesis associated RND transporter like protein HpnN